MTKGLLHIGVSASRLPPDPTRNLFKGKTLLFAEESMLHWIMSAGAVPVLIPTAGGALSAAQIMAELDGLVLTGGSDMAPGSYGEVPARPEWGGDALRDAYEMELVRLALAQGKPLLGVCRGLQVLNVALGGTLYQDLETMHPERPCHRQWDIYDRHQHDVVVAPGSSLAGWYGLRGDAPSARVNSVHHQGVKSLAAGLVVEARSVPDGVIEAVRYAGPAASLSAPAPSLERSPWAYAVQWHPEFSGQAASPILDAEVLLRNFLAAVSAHQSARPAGASSTARVLRIVNPATDGELVDVPEDTPATITVKVRRARAAQRDWQAVPLERRLAVLRRWKELLAEQRDELALTLTREMGKPIREAKNELDAMAGRLDFFLEQTPAVLKARTVLAQPPAAGAMTERIEWEPLGLVANVSAWNYPYFVGSNVFVPALLCGNAVLYKPSEHATLTGLRIEKLLIEAGVPSDLFVSVIGGGDVGAAVVDADVDAVFFTGSHTTGRAIAQRVAGRMVKLQLELGGKDPVYVCDDVDPAAAAAALVEGAFYNAGQSCCAVERLYVHQRIAAAFIAAFVAETAKLVVGDPEDERTTMGPLARKAQLSVLDAQVADALQRGARLLCGGKRMARPGHFFEPTVLCDVTPAMAVMRDESFGPIIGIQVVADDAEAIRLMNDTAYGLTAGVYTNDGDRARVILAQADAGSVYWNCCDRVSPRLPWTGRKHSGIGSTLSTLGIETFARPKAWHLRSPAR